MADDISYKIHGDDLQLVEIVLDPGEGVRAEVGAMTFMEHSVEMQTKSDGIFSGLKRIFAGENFFVTTFMNTGKQPSAVGFGAPYPGKVVPIDLNAFEGEFLCQKDSFLCAASGIDISVAFTKRFGAGFFGGEGFVLQRLSGKGMAFVHAGGTVIAKDLAKGEVLRVDTGCVVGMSSTVDYDIESVSGFKNMLFGGEGLFLTKLTGPGRVYLQSLPFSRLVSRIHAALPPPPVPPVVAAATSNNG